jgi:hypothetical protein
VGLVLLTVLSALAAFAALAVAVRARLRGRAETLIAATLLWNLIIIAPIYTLGLTGQLYRGRLALASLLASAVTLVLASRGVGVRTLVRETTAAFRQQLRLPWDALALTWQARSMIFVGVAFAAVLLPYLAVTAYFAQQQPHWDPLWYHDAMTGFAIQNHSFAMVDLPINGGLQKINGYTRLGEMTQLWMVIFWDRRLADATNLLFAPALAASGYVLARRYTGTVIALGWGLAALLMFGCLNLLHSTFVDPQNAALMLGGVVFSTVDPPRLRDSWLAALGLALAIASKGLALVPVPVTALIAAWLALRTHWRDRRRAVIATVAGGAALIVGLASVTYLRNYLAFHNPFWPDLKVDINALGIHWPGQNPWYAEAGRAGSTVNLNTPAPDLIKHLFVLPWSVRGTTFEATLDYGIGVEWVAIPLAAVALAACFVVAVRSYRQKRSLTPSERSPVLLAIVLLAMVAGSPALWAARYHAAGIGLVAAMCAWLTGRPPWDRLSEAAASIVLVTSIMMFWWTPVPRWWFTPAELLAHIRAPALDREVDRNLGAPTLRTVGLAREQELGPGSLLVFNEHHSAFISLFWNNHFSNRIMYMKDGPDFLTRAAAAGATWVFLNDRDPLVSLARRPASGWQEVGVLNPINGGFAFRRLPAKVSAPPPAPPPPPGPPPRPRPPRAAGVTPSARR